MVDRGLHKPRSLFRAESYHMQAGFLFSQESLAQAEAASKQSHPPAVKAWPPSLSARFHRARLRYATGPDRTPHPDRHGEGSVCLSVAWDYRHRHPLRPKHQTKQTNSVKLSCSWAHRQRANTTIITIIVSSRDRQAAKVTSSCLKSRRQRNWAKSDGLASSR